MGRYGDWVSTLEERLDPWIAPHLATSALLVVDTQRDFVDGGSSPIAGTTQVLPAIARLLEAYRSASRPIVHIVRLYAGDDVDLVRRSAIAAGARMASPGTAGSQIVPEFGVADLDPDLLLRGGLQQVSPTEVVLFKPRWSAFHRTDLESHLRERGVDTVVVAGCNYPNCPRATIVDASERDLRVLIAADAISGVDDRHLEEAGRIGAVHATAAEIAAALD
ncbi:Nicotinamidase-related amidase [Rhodococcus maanshanensis]|uniref:Nicotinamidase-related amidase n=1 Tax=Rhodococcus maanshanensis TaxID=183556 RepID=A0A1H7J893_9NOCA|nr:Nicotinamidase-related amidase [Rhodococcus maanshanensis]